MRLSLAFTLASLSLAACGGDDTNTTPDANDDIGFNTPTVTLKANREVTEDNWEEIGPADLSCLNTASADVASTVSVTLNMRVTDFQSGNAVPSATVSVFHNQDHAGPFDTQTSDTSANITFTIPVGTKRFGYRMTSANALPTFLLNQTLDSPSEAVQPSNTPPCMDGTQTVTCRSKISSVSNATAATLPALIGQTRIVGTGVVAGALRDCQEREISGFIATMSSMSTTANPMMGAEAYYFSSSVGLPVHHNQAQFSSHDGLFMIIQVPTSTPTGYVQMWGFPTDADLAMGRAGLKLIAELEVPILADTVITGSYEPLRTN
jgi:hypothetical protein